MTNPTLASNAVVSPVWLDAANPPPASAIPQGFVACRVVGQRVSVDLTNAPGVIVYENGDYLVLPRAQADVQVAQRAVVLV